MGKRMYWILKIIQDNHSKAISAKDIVKELEKHNIYVDIKTVYSCIQRINEFFFEWIHTNMIIPIKKSGYVIENEFFLDGELQFILDSITYHQDLDIDDKLKLRDKFMMLSSQHQQSRLVDSSSKDKALTFSLFLNLSTIMKAIENQTVISFQYINYEVKNHKLIEIPSVNGNIKDQYFISPYQIILNNNHYYLISYNDKHKNTLTTYRIDRMRMIRTVHQPFIEIREQYDMVDEIEKMTNMYISKQRTTLEIQCHQRLLREVVSHFGKDIEAKKMDKETYLIKVNDVSLSEGLIGWIMMLQDQIKIISPLFLQQDIRNRLIKMSSLYKDVI